MSNTIDYTYSSLRRLTWKPRKHEHHCIFMCSVVPRRNVVNAIDVTAIHRSIRKYSQIVLKEGAIRYSAATPGANPTTASRRKQRYPQVLSPSDAGHHHTPRQRKATGRPLRIVLKVGAIRYSGDSTRGKPRTPCPPDETTHTNAASTTRPTPPPPWRQELRPTPSNRVKGGSYQV